MGTHFQEEEKDPSWKGKLGNSGDFGGLVCELSVPELIDFDLKGHLQLHLLLLLFFFWIGGVVSGLQVTDSIDMDVLSFIITFSFHRSILLVCKFYAGEKPQSEKKNYGSDIIFT